MINLQSFKDKEQDYSKHIAPYFSMDKMQRHYHTVNAILAERVYEVDPEYFYKKMFHTSDYFVSAPFYEEIGGMQDELREKRGECVYLTFKDEQPRIAVDLRLNTMISI